MSFQSDTQIIQCMFFTGDDCTEEFCDIYRGKGDRS